MQKKVTILSKDEELNKKRLEAAILLLKTDRIIKRDSDIADDLEYSRAIVSQYKNGIRPVTFAFIKRFEQHYKIRFSNIDIGEKVKKDPDPVLRMLALIAKKIGIPEKEIARTLK